jgi:hypothetical protein
VLIGLLPEDEVLPLDEGLHQDEGDHVEGVEQQAEQRLGPAWSRFFQSKYFRTNFVILQF